MDIVCEIVDACDWDSLASCARVNTLFSDPALNSLWRYQHDIDPLLCILPPWRGALFTGGCYVDTFVSVTFMLAIIVFQYYFVLAVHSRRPGALPLLCAQDSNARSTRMRLGSLRILPETAFFCSREHMSTAAASRAVLGATQHDR